eukprot:TRINITY_DN17269_c0_g1_i1.p1 TRINITY_DN17269_c0_g1~~TRINITY_DN17269_c0_g1_i1.p1  ORF type:complete len:405 (+),score=105.58 TRINITY_DN17269_c0_g1_i1:39-1253(+)
MDLYYGSLAVCSVAFGALWLRTKADEQPEQSSDNSRGFRSFRRNYLSAYALAYYSDWLKGPYVYALYTEYGFGKADIATLFVAGFLSSAVFGTLAGAASDQFGRRAMCVVFCAVYAGSALTKLVPEFYTLMLGRLLAGIATSLLSTCFESWMVSEHHARAYPPHLLKGTFGSAVQLTGFTAVLAGLSASFVADRHGYAAPFVLALAPLAVLAALVVATWNENYGDRKASPLAAWSTAASAFAADSYRLVWLGAAQSLFEGGMFLWVFLWTPMLKAAARDAGPLPYGVIFAAFMAALMLGSQLFTLAGGGAACVYGIHAGAAVASVVSAMALGWGESAPAAMMAAFLVFEMCCGAFFPAYGVLRATYIPDSSRGAVSNAIRVPMNGGMRRPRERVSSASAWSSAS